MNKSRIINALPPLANHMRAAAAPRLFLSVDYDQTIMGVMSTSEVL
jgi:hypothetical protein